MIGFLVAGGLTQIIALLLHRLRDCKSHTLGPNGLVTKTHITFRIASALAPSAVDDPLQFWINIISVMLIGLSDQQLVMGLLILAIICGTKGASFSMYMACYISYFALITHAATMITLRSYFRKFKWMTTIRIITMLATFCLWIVANAAVFGLFNLIRRSALPDSYTVYKDYLLSYQQRFTIIFIVELVAMIWVYSSMIPSLFISDEHVRVRKAVAKWPIRKEVLDDSTISSWILDPITEVENDNTGGLMKKSFRDSLLRPYKLFCRLYLRTKSKPGRVILWLVAEILFPWALIPVVLFVLFLALMIALSSSAQSYEGDTVWSFGQILPPVLVVLPFWTLAQAYAGK
jgi:hypothetical protein